VVAGPPDFLANIEVSRGLEPSSHRDPSWIHQHRDVFDASCTNCHTADDPGGVSNTSFCSNSACHGNVWEFAGFDAPGLREIVLAKLPQEPTPTPLPEATSVTFETVVGPILAQRCVACHGGASPIAGLDLSSFAGAMNGSAAGAVVVPGDAAGSRLIAVQSGPQNHFGQLTPEELELVQGWIDDGAPEN
jgi:mono/diheme cytochrome c family protein